jgi:hypothetical protein
MNRKAAAVAAVLVLAGLAGCAQISVHTTVAADGTIEEYKTTINTSTTVYGLLSQQAENEGYNDIGAYLTSDINKSAYDDVVYNETVNQETATMTLRLIGFDPSNEEPISTTRSNGTLEFEDRSFVSDSIDGSIDSESSIDIGSDSGSGAQVEYTLRMPGEITNSTADEVDGDTATWTINSSSSDSESRIYAESEVPSGGFGPGFGVTGAVSGVIAAVGLVLLRRRN